MIRTRELPKPVETWNAFWPPVERVTVVECGDTLSMTRDLMPPESVCIRAGATIITNGYRMFLLHGTAPFNARVK